MEINMPIKNAYLCKVGVLRIYPKSEKHSIDISGMSFFECHCDSLDLEPIKGD